MKITVVLPTRNRRRALEVCLNSLANQTFRDFQVVISNNGSKDETKSLTDHERNGIRCLVRHRYPEFPGLAEHYQKLFGEVETEWFALAHDDEIYHPEWLSTLFGQVKSSDALSFCQIILRDIRGSGPPTFHKKPTSLPAGRFDQAQLKREAIINGRFLPGQAFLIRTEAARPHLNYMQQYEQYDFALLYEAVGDMWAVASDKLLATYTVHQSNTLSSGEYASEASLRIHPCDMLKEWVEKDPGFSEVRKDILKRLERDKLGGEFRLALRAWPMMEGEAWKSLTTRITNSQAASIFHQSSVRLLSFVRRFPGTRSLWRKLLKRRARRPLSHQIETSLLADQFPDVLQKNTWMPFLSAGID